jgi:NADH-quinone oxidoreductase subunit H
MPDLLRSLVALLLWPGLLAGALLGWFFLWLSRKSQARMQGRQGPPFYQPFFDFLKLVGKRTVLPAGAPPGLFYGLPWLSLLCITAALSLIPAPGSPSQGFRGDLILLLYLLEMPVFLDILAGYITRSPYAQVGAAREASMMLGYNLPFLTALVALAIHAGSASLYTIAAQPLGPVHLLAGAALLLALPARLKTTPFSISNAEQEILAGPHTEYNGLPLGIFELVHALELAALAGLFAALLVGPLPDPFARFTLYLVISAGVVLSTAVLSAVTARLKVQHALRFYWRWGALAAVLAVGVAVIW